jgi:hypothetical protein
MKTEVDIAVNAGIDKLMQQRNALRGTKKDLLALLVEDYPDMLRGVACHLFTKPVTSVTVERFYLALKIFNRDLRN